MSGLVWQEKPMSWLERGEADPSVVASLVYNGPFAWVRDAVSGRELVSAMVYRVSVGDDDYAVVVMCRVDDAGIPAWTVYCGDKQVSGSVVGDGQTLAGILRMEGKVSTGIINACEQQAWVGLIPEQSGCPFFKMQERDRLCSHTKAVLASLSEEVMLAQATSLNEWKSGVAPAAVARVRSPEEMAARRVAFIEPLMLAGERGSGKTYFARSMAEELDAVYLEMQLHPAMEPWEFRMHDRACDGKIYSVMGKLAEAVYWIQQGKRVVLVLDEFLNMNPVYQTVINSPLSLTGNDTYLIETGRLIPMEGGLARVETVEVPRDMLWVIATTNVGARYGLDKIAPSVLARFRVVMMNTNAERIEQIVSSTLTEHGLPLGLAPMFKLFIERVKQAVDEGTLAEEATTRLACNVIRVAALCVKQEKRKLTSLKHWVTEIKGHLADEIGQCVTFENGMMDPDQSKLYLGLIGGCFKA